MVGGQSKTIVVTGVHRTPAGEVLVEAALHERAQSGGGFAYEATGLRMCVSFVVPRPGRGEVRAQNIPCPPGVSS